MKILHISKFYPPFMGGIESVAFELVDGMNRRGLVSDVLCANVGPRTVREQHPDGYRIVRAGAFAKVLSTSMSPALIVETASMARHYDVLHVHMPDPMAALALWLTRPRGKVVLHWHSDVVNQRRALKLYEPLQDWILRRADAIIATSAPYAEASPSLRAHASKVEVVPIGITPVPHPDAAQRAEALQARYPGRKIVFALGRMTYYKGFDVLIDAARTLPADSIVLVGGGGELLQTYRDRVKAEGLQDRIAFVGRISDEEIPGYFHAARVFCMSSIVRAEAYGVVLVEAMEAGLPIVATDIPGSGVPWVNQHGVTGLNVPVQDPAALSDALARILGDAALARTMGDASRRRFQDSFTAKTMVDRTVDLYHRILS